MNDTNLKERIAYYMFVEGTKNTTQANWTFYFTEISEEFKISTEQVEEMFEDIKDILLTNEDILDVWGPEETGEGVFDITFSSKYSEDDYEEDEITPMSTHYEVEEWDAEDGEVISSNSFDDYKEAKWCYDHDYASARYRRLLYVIEDPWDVHVMEMSW